MHVCVCLMCVYLVFRVMLNDMTKVATPLLASSSSLGHPFGVPRVFLTWNTCLPKYKFNRLVSRYNLYDMCVSLHVLDEVPYTSCHYNFKITS